MKRIDRIRGGAPTAQVEQRYSLEDYAHDLGLGGMQPFSTTWGATDKTEGLASSFTSYVDVGYKRNPVVFSVLGARLRLFSQARFLFQSMADGRPGDLYDDRSLDLLRTPWLNGTTGDLLGRMEQDASLAGNSYTARRTIIDKRGRRTELRRLQPDRVQILLGSPTTSAEDIDSGPLGYLYWPKGINSGKYETLLVEDVAHYAPIPDPVARYRGMSWLTPIVEEIRSDSAATEHKGKFFDNAATPNMVISLDKALPKAEFIDLVEEMKKHEGSHNAYKTMWLGGGADAKVVGADFKQLDFKMTQGAGETRIAAAGGVPPIIVGLSEGLQAATYSNYGQARRSFSDGFAADAWARAAAALQSIVSPPNPGDRLWVDTAGIPFLQEDQRDEADILAARMSTIAVGVNAGYKPESVVAAVEAGDLRLMEHTGLYSVQLQPPGTSPAPLADPA